MPVIDPVTGEDLEELELQRLKTALRDAEAVRRMLVERIARLVRRTDKLEAQVKRLQKAKGRK